LSSITTKVTCNAHDPCDKKILTIFKQVELAILLPSSYIVDF